jgi:hypothetical protein
MPTTPNPATQYTTQNGIVHMDGTTKWIFEISIIRCRAVRLYDTVLQYGYRFPLPIDDPERVKLKLKIGGANSPGMESVKRMQSGENANRHAISPDPEGIESPNIDFNFNDIGFKKRFRLQRFNPVGVLRINLRFPIIPAFNNVPLFHTGLLTFNPVGVLDSSEK